MVFCQKASGYWNDELYKYLKSKSYTDLKSLQTKDIQAHSYDEKVLLTIVGLRMLMYYFNENKKEWKLVGLKGRNYLKKTLGKSDKEINDLLASIHYELDFSNLHNE